ncbi:MAG: CoA pyrophosphatase [Chitinophagales bacterium]|nr:CoA pyrophosphatase [Chitinophagales bacterium]MDW8393490.1 CoA pyrophosphatase [Chitinophagales bacterium]
MAYKSADGAESFFDAWLSALRLRLQQPLPGLPAHARMAPEGRLNEKYHQAIRELKGQKSAVLVLLYPRKGQIFTVLIRRAAGIGPHSGQVGFPGGKAEPEDADAIATALREANEELGLNTALLQVLGTLTPVYIPVSRQTVFPVLAAAGATPVLNPRPLEVQGVLRVNCSQLHDPKRHKKGTFLTAGGERIVAPYFLLNRNKVWGATALVLSELAELLRRPSS